MLAAMRSPMRRSAAADSSELSPSVGSVPVERDAGVAVGAGEVGAGDGVVCVKTAGLAAKAAISNSFLKWGVGVKCLFPGGLNKSANPYDEERLKRFCKRMKETTQLTHFNAEGRAHMVDVAGKSATHRSATAAGRIVMLPATLALVLAGSAKKGDVLGIARIAGIMAAKKTSDLIPLCHPLALTHVSVEFTPDEAANCITCQSVVETIGPTGVEMEALTAVQIALLTIYDMCKAVDRGMTMTDVRVLEKHGGKSGSFSNQ